MHHHLMAFRDLLGDFVSNDVDHDDAYRGSIFVAVLCLCIIVGHLVKKKRWINESVTAILIGLAIGTIILLSGKGRDSHILMFNEDLFFIYILPPIIFNAGFQVKKKQFFHNFATIMLFGVVGVFISVAVISAGCWWIFPKIGLKGKTSDSMLGMKGLSTQDYLALGVIFSSTDSICTLQVLKQDETPRLYSLVFGESVVNDATAVVLFNAIRKIDVSRLENEAVAFVIGDFLYLFLASTILGITAGLLTAYVLKSLYFGRHSTDREIGLMVLMPYLSYMLAELFQLSGILTVFFCGIFMSHYAWHNITENSRITTRHIFATLSFIAETFIYFYVGMDALDIEKWKRSETSLTALFGIYGTIVFLVLAGRAAFVFPISALLNYISPNPDSAITFKQQVIIWWAGLMRGAVSMALAFSQFTFDGVTWEPIHATMITSTLVVVLLSIMVFGMLTKPLIATLLPHRNDHKNKDQVNQQPKDDSITVSLISAESSDASPFWEAKSSLSVLLERPVHTIHAHWRKFDDKYMRPVFGGPT